MTVSDSGLVGKKEDLLDVYYPYLLDYGSFSAEKATIFVVAALLAVMVSAEGQALGAALLGDTRPGARDRFHFNVFLHLSLLGSLSFLVAGFGWAKEMAIDPGRFPRRPRLCLVASRLFGPLANLLLASIAGSINWILTSWGVTDEVFSMVTVVNVTMAVYGLLPLPPLPGAAPLIALCGGSRFGGRAMAGLKMVGPWVIVGFFAVSRLADWHTVDRLFTPVIQAVTGLILGL